jgi:hypothetical protein
MALHVIIEATPDEDRRWRAEIDPHDGWTRLFDGTQRIASAWFCAPSGWERVDPDRPVIRSALARVATTLVRLGFTPVRADDACHGGVDEPGSKAV